VSTWRRSRAEARSSPSTDRKASVALELVDDDELLEELQAMGLRRGLIRSPNAVIVVSR
jgi:hypothetical protein